jgi:hypothetical protein
MQRGLENGRIRVARAARALQDKEPKCAAEATARKNGAADLHSMAAWENIFILKSLMEVSPDEATLLRSSPTAGRSAMGSRP